jgi:hypothetical protein
MRDSVFIFLHNDRLSFIYDLPYLSPEVSKLFIFKHLLLLYLGQHDQFKNKLISLFFLI